MTGGIRLSHPQSTLLCGGLWIAVQHWALMKRGMAINDGGTVSSSN